MSVLRRFAVLLPLALLVTSCSSADTLATVNGTAITRDDLNALRPSYSDATSLDAEQIRQDLTLLIILEAVQQPQPMTLATSSPRPISPIVWPTRRIGMRRCWPHPNSLGRHHRGGPSQRHPELGERRGCSRSGGKRCRVRSSLQRASEEVTRACVRHISTASLAEAEDALIRLNGGEDFATLAAEISLDQVSPGGLIAGGTETCLVFLTRAGLEFANLVATVPLNEPAGPVVANDEWNVIVVEERQGPESVADLAANAMDYLNPDYVSALYTPWLNDAVRAADIDVSPTVGRWSEGIPHRVNSRDLLIVGLGPAGLDRIPSATLELLDDAERRVIVRTLHHPASRQLAERRAITSCDDLYEAANSFDQVYADITARVLAGGRARCHRILCAGLGRRWEGRFAISAGCGARGGSYTLLPGESFLDLAYAAAGVDPIADAVKVVDGRALPDPLIFDVPIVITQVDRAEVVADVAAQLGRVLDDAAPVLVLDRLGDEDEIVHSLPAVGADRVPVRSPDDLYLNPGPHGWYGLVATNRILRQECPWDRKQTHHSLLSHLIEEAYETVATIRSLAPDAPRGDPDFGIYAEVEEELGDLLLQVVFHATLAREAGAFDVEEVAEITRRKLVNRHPHVFGDVVAEDAATVITNWESIKSEEKSRESLMDDIPAAMPAITRADKMQRRARSSASTGRTPLRYSPRSVKSSTSCSPLPPTRNVPQKSWVTYCSPSSTSPGI